MPTCILTLKIELLFILLFEKLVNDKLTFLKKSIRFKNACHSLNFRIFRIEKKKFNC